MKSILDEIINNKLHEVSGKKKKRDFLGSIINPKVGDISIIAEIKLASPSAGRLGNVIDMEKKAKAYEAGFADAISVVVDKKYFGGELEFIRKVKGVVSLPVLAKDFVIDPYQIYEAKAYGADSVVLIAKIVSCDQLVQLVKLAIKLNIEPIVEVQNREELDEAINTKSRCIAVNARDLNTFTLDMDKACQLLKLVPEQFIPLAFSGVQTREDVKKYIDAGARAVLVGTSLMKEEGAEKFIAQLKGFRNFDKF